MNTNILKLVNWILKELSSIRKHLDLIQPHASTVSNDWIPWKEAMSFFEYKDTQMAEMVMEKQLIVAKVGRRKFIKRSSIIELLEKSVTSETDNHSSK